MFMRVDWSFSQINLKIYASVEMFREMNLFSYGNYCSKEKEMKFDRDCLPN
jgi:hypothetical protein